LATNKVLRSLFHLQVREGRFLEPFDQNMPYIVLGFKVGKIVGGGSVHAALGRSIRIGGQYFRVIGVLKKIATSWMIPYDLNRSIFLSFAARARLPGLQYLDILLLRYAPLLARESLEKKITTFLKHLTGAKKVMIMTPQTIMNQIKVQKRAFDWLLGAIGGVSLLVGGIGIMNIMLVSVMERRHEIGIRLAVGATSANIALMFLQEALLLAITGGLCGAALGFLVTWLVSLSAHWPFTFLFWPMSLALGVAVFSGLFFGFYPAWKASRLQPIEALRQIG
jgi:putative ABC transport system permease protein